MRTVLAIALVCLSAASAAIAQAKSAAALGLERLKALQGEWIDVDGAFGQKGRVAVTYRVTGAGHSIVETFPAGTANEMVTVYHLDGNDLVLTHYCSSNTQPRMVSKGLQGDVLDFEFAGGANIDPSKTSHMHAARIEFVAADEIKATWHNWSNGKADHSATFRVVRKR
jgi:hypothetical protein